MFFLMRYQSAVASRREINFARQLFRIIFFIIAMEQHFAEPLPECFRGKIALDSAAMTDRDPAGFLRDHDRDRVRFFGDPERRAMPQAETAIERLALAHRENAGRGGDPAVAHDHAAIVQRRFRMKQA